MDHRCSVVGLFGVFVLFCMENINNKFPSLGYWWWWSCILSALFSSLLYEWPHPFLWISNSRINDFFFFVCVVFRFVYNNQHAWQRTNGCTKRATWNLKEMKWAQIRFDTIAAYGSDGSIHTHTHTHSFHHRMVHRIVWNEEEEKKCFQQHRTNSSREKNEFLCQKSSQTTAHELAELLELIQCMLREHEQKQENNICFWALFHHRLIIAIHFDHGIQTKEFISEWRSQNADLSFQQLNRLQSIHFNTFWYDRGISFIVHTFKAACQLIHERSFILLSASVIDWFVSRGERFSKCHKS